MLRDTRNLLDNIHHYGVAFVDLRCYLQGHTNVFSLDRLKGVRHTIGRAGVCIATGDEGHLLTYSDKCLFVIQCKQTGRGQDVCIALRL